MKIQIIKNEKDFDVISKYDKNLVTIVKSFQGSKFNKINKSWKIMNEYLEELNKQLTEQKFEIEMIDQKPEPSIVSIQFKEDSFVIDLPLPKSVYTHLFTIKKINVTKDTWELSRFYFMYFYQLSLTINFTILVKNPHYKNKNY